MCDVMHIVSTSIAQNLIISRQSTTHVSDMAHTHGRPIHICEMTRSYEYIHLRDRCDMTHTHV